MEGLSDDKTGLLKSFLGSLPGEVAARLARAVEADRMLDGTLLPHEMILASLRPVLRGAPDQRTQTPMRLFCRPFEDLLDSAPRTAKQKAAISRASVAPVWQWLCETLAPVQAQAFVAAVKPLAVARKTDELTILGREFHSFAGAAIEDALGDDAGRQAARAVLGGEDVVADAAEMAMLLRAARQVARIQLALPRPVAQLNEELLWALREIYDALVQDHPDVAPFVAVIAMNRLVKPCEALRLPMMICRQTHDTLIAQTDMGLVGEILFARMDQLQSSIMQTRHPHFETETLLAQVARFAELSSAIVKEIEVRRDGEWGQRLFKERSTIGAVMDNFMDRALREFSAALPMHKTAGAQAADFSRILEPEKQAMGLKYARLVMGSRNFAAAASFGAKQKTVAEELCNYLGRYNEDMTRALRGGPGQAVAQSQSALCIALSAILFSEEEAELLKRRVRAAGLAA